MFTDFNCYLLKYNTLSVTYVQVMGDTRVSGHSYWWWIQLTPWKYHWSQLGCCWGYWAGLLWGLYSSWYVLQGSVYSLLSLFEDQALKLLGSSIVVLSYSGLGLLSLRLRTKYQISHTVERHSPGSASLSAAKYSLCPPHWGYSEAAQVLLTSSLLQKTYCHTTCPVDVTL